MTHLCHHPDCEITVPGKMWACRIHWYPLPATLRRVIWDTYDPELDEASAPTVDYVEAAMACFSFWNDQSPTKGQNEDRSTP